MLKKKYYDGTQIHRIISEEVKDYDTIMKILKRFADEPSALGTNLAEVGTDLISRKAAIDALHTWFRDGFDEDKWWNSTHVLAAIEGLPPAQRTDLLKAEIKRMKRLFTACNNSDYYTGYMSALSAVEGYIAQLEGANKDAD